MFLYVELARRSNASKHTVKEKAFKIFFLHTHNFNFFLSFAFITVIYTNIRIAVVCAARAISQNEYGVRTLGIENR